MKSFKKSLAAVMLWLVTISAVAGNMPGGVIDPPTEPPVTASPIVEGSTDFRLSEDSITIPGLDPLTAITQLLNSLLSLF